MRTQRQDGALRVIVSERDIRDPSSLHAEFEKLICEQGERRIVVDLAEIHTMTSLMVGALVSIHLMAYENVVMLEFENMHTKIRKLFKLIGVESLVDAHYGRDDAVRSARFGR